MCGNWTANSRKQTLDTMHVLEQSALAYQTLENNAETSIAKDGKKLTDQTMEFVLYVRVRSSRFLELSRYCFPSVSFLDPSSGGSSRCHGSQTNPHLYPRPPSRPSPGYFLHCSLCTVLSWLLCKYKILGCDLPHPKVHLPHVAGYKLGQCTTSQSKLRVSGN